MMTYSTTASLVAPDGTLDRRSVAIEARRQYQQAQQLGLGWSFGRCMAFAWRKAKGQRSLTAFDRLEVEPRLIVDQHEANDAAA